MPRRSSISTWTTGGYLPLFTSEAIGLAKMAAITREVQWDCGHFVHLVFGDAAHLMDF